MKILFRSHETWPDGGSIILLQSRDADLSASLAEAVRLEGVEGLCAMGDAPGTVYAPASPVFDDLLALWLLGDERRAGLDPAIAEELCSFAGLARQGLDPSKSPVESNPRTIFEEIKRQYDDLTQDEQARPFIRRSFKLLDHVVRRMADGSTLDDASLFEGTTTFAQEIAMLRKDRQVYEEDRERGQVLLATVQQGSVDRQADLLVMEEPVSVRFADWARKDETSPSGTGYALLLIRWPGDMWVLSSDPAKRLPIGHLAAKLQAAESPYDAEQLAEDPWYDGNRHRGTLVASPHAGTTLNRQGILTVLREELGLREDQAPARPPEFPMRAAVGAGIGLMVAAVIAMVLWMVLQPPPDPEITLVDRGSPVEDPSAIATTTAAARGRTHFAVIAGVNKYTTMDTLACANADARALLEILVGSYGYDRANIHYLIDDPTDGEAVDGPPTTDGLRKAIEGIGDRTREHADSTFLFFYAGHGERLKKASPIGFLIPSGSDDPSRENDPLDTRYYDMQHLPGDIEKYVSSRHSVILTDCCFSGFTLKDRGEQDMDPRLYELWKEEARVILTAGTEGQTAKEDPRDLGHSLFTQAVLNALTVDSKGLPGADDNEDGILTDAELGGYVSRWVPKKIAQYGSTQHPQYYRDEGNAAKVGQFLFVPDPSDSPGAETP